MIQCQVNKTLRGAGGMIDLDAKIEFPQHSFTVLFGESGAGKTSILRMLAGLMTPEKGRIAHAEKIWFDHGKKINLAPQKRRVGFVFQDQGLFPNMSVRQNLEFALRSPDQKFLINEIIESFELDDLEHVRPNTLSGGQKQKVALARSIVNQPEILLLDEPLSALDLRSKIMLQDHIQKMHEKFKLTTIMVSHDLSEVHKIADRILKLDHGKVIEVSKDMVFGDHFKSIRGTILAADPDSDQIRLEINITVADYEKLKQQINENGDINLMA